jgi:hypothetical protein
LGVPNQKIIELRAVGERCPQKPNHLFDALGAGLWISGGVTQPNQEPEMSQNAVADLAEPRKVNEQPHLEKGWQWIVQIGKTAVSVPQDEALLKRKQNAAMIVSEAPGSNLEMAEFSIVTRTSSKALIPELIAGPAKREIESAACLARSRAIVFSLKF